MTDSQQSSIAILEQLATAPRLALAIDLDGTLIALAGTPGEATLDADARQVLSQLADCPDTHVALVTGRSRGDVASFAEVPRISLVAEHGVVRREVGGTWTELRLSGTAPDRIERALHDVAASYAGTLVERKLWSVCIHYRRVRAPEREAAVVEATELIEEWIAGHPEYELLEGRMALEVRHRDAHKGRAIEWMRERLPQGTLLVALGDDATDEDAFGALGPSDIAISVGPRDRPSRAHARLESVDEVRALIAWIAVQRADRGRARGRAPVELRVASAITPAVPLVVVSNRLPTLSTEDVRAAEVGGLVSGLSDALRAHHGLWLGWSGQRHDEPDVLAIDEVRSRASFDLAPEEYALYYNGLANRALWPTFHGFVERARFREAEWVAYVEVNRRVAEHVRRLVMPNGLVWVHDFHLLLVARTLRARGHRGKLGHFLHIPFPASEAFETLACARELIESMLAFDLLGFQTVRHADNFARIAEQLADARAHDGGVVHQRGRTRLGVFPLGIDPDAFSADGADEEELGALKRGLDGRKLVLGVDRLDYTKGILERIDAFARMLEIHPEWRRAVTLLQVCVPSRSEVPEYAAQRAAIEGAVGRVNGQFGESHWVPIRYVCRSYDRPTLAGLYRAADVGLVTPLRDGMNLVAKEYVAAQDPESPGVLVLSRFAGAADELSAAVLTNPFHRGGMARDIAMALSMPMVERVARHRKLMVAVRRHRPTEWAAEFLRALSDA